MRFFYSIVNFQYLEKWSASLNDPPNDPSKEEIDLKLLPVL